MLIKPPFCFRILVIVSIYYHSLSIIGFSVGRSDSGNEDYLSVKFLLFTRLNPNEPAELITLNRTSLSTTLFNSYVPTKVIIHGYFSNVHNEIFTLIKDAYLESGDYNIIGMDWSILSNRDYISALRGLMSAAKALVYFLNWMQIYHYANINEMHLIGHSLGSHLAGLVVSDRFPLIGTLYRITGLDPASPGFKSMPSDLRLDKNDAVLVDVIHTSSNALAIDKPLGHVDFYPNGGFIQPGCPRFFQIRNSITCNHARSYWYFAESIRNPYGFTTFKCDNYMQAIRQNCTEQSNVFMGNVNTYEPGVYFLRTRSRTPFSNNIGKK